MGRDLLALVPFGHIWLNLGLDPLADFVSEGGVGIVKVGGGILGRRKTYISLRIPRFSRGSKTYTLVP
jgi:hypothetical protein